MIAIDQNSALASLEAALVPPPELVDARTERDRLFFLANFAGLINFYDSSNTKAGHWAPFLLKDPVFLLAHISQTEFRKLHTAYHSAIVRIEGLMQKQGQPAEIAINLDRLFDEFTDIFMKLERWTFYMQMCDLKYELKTFLIQQIKTIYSPFFWAMQSLRESLFISDTFEGIKPVRYYRFDDFDKIIWCENKNKSPYWEVLGCNKTSADQQDQTENISSCFSALVMVGEKLFGLLYEVINQASSQYEVVSRQRSHFPDTTLLRTFVDLLKVQQEQLNGVSNRHLDFYYRDILKQVELPARADKAFICAALAKPDAAFTLPSGTAFSAGLDAQKKMILFSTAADVSLNPAQIVSVSTLVKGDGAALCLTQIENPDTVQTDENGNVLSWPTFGTAKATPTTVLNAGIAIASPMLYLTGGQRDVYFIITCSPINSLVEILGSAQYFLSTAKVWLPLPKFDPASSSLTYVNVYPANPTDPNKAIIHISLKMGDPAIEPFTINPDGIKSDWPLLKIVFDTLPTADEEPKLTALTIQVIVNGLATFKLSNDLGALSTTGPYPPFGPTPLVNNSFIIGNTEIFSKSFYQLRLRLNWDTLPPDFQAYYQPYNNYLATLNPPVTIATQADTVSTNIFAKFFDWIWKIILMFFHLLIKLFIVVFKFLIGIIVDLFRWLLMRGNCTDGLPENQTDPFNNTCFKVVFSLLEKSVWQPISVINPAIPTPGNTNFEGQFLFDSCVVNSENQLANSPGTVFTYNTVVMPDIPCLTPGTVTAQAGDPLMTVVPDPEIQQITANYSATSTSGFMRMVLTDPLYGFGSSIYPNVISYIVLNNGVVISRGCPPSHLIAMANVPFAPKLLTLSADYSAIQDFDLTAPVGSYPLQCFLYTPFANYAIYDNTIPPPAGSTEPSAVSSDSTEDDHGQSPAGIPLLSVMKSAGVLFIELKQLVPANTLNLYFELTRNYPEDNTEQTITFSYLAAKSWKELNVVADGTNNFNCSGVITFNIPADISNTSGLMPGNNYWISLSVSGNPDAFPGTVYLNTNGFEVQRSGPSFLTGSGLPAIKSNTITQPQTAIAAVTTIVQPFPSFGGKAAETKAMLNKRVSNRLKTKNRVITAEDYCRLINQEFDDIYYAKAVSSDGGKATTVYLVKNVASTNAPNAYLPLITACQEAKVKTWLQKRVSAFNTLTVSNFDLYYLSVNATITIKPAYTFNSVSSKLNQALKIYLSPWIPSTLPQVLIDQPVTRAAVAEFVKMQDGVQDVEGVSFVIQPYDVPAITQIEVSPGEAFFEDPLAGSLFVSAENHTITQKAS